MSEAELNRYLTRHPADPHSRLIRYSLGFRQLRRGDYRGAEQTFLSLGSWLKIAERKFATETSHGKPTMPPLRFARAMLALQAREATASGPEEKAQAAYETGQLLFYQRHLVFYNAALWQGGRTWALEMNHPYDIRTRDSQISREEQAKLDRYQQEHTVLFHAAHVFERIVHDYPHTRVAPRALYSAALSYTLLQAVEGYWHRSPRWEKKAISLYRQLLRDYPNDPLAPAAAKFGGAVRKGHP
jgi:outer membrane protein assembly factor BamD (BamD/ComL family)